MSPASRPAYLALYQEAAARFELDWEVLAAVGRVETNHGRNRNGCAPNAAGAQGPMQFLPATFAHAAKLAGHRGPRHLRPGRRHPRGRGVSRRPTAPPSAGTTPSTATTRPTGTRRWSCAGPCATGTARRWSGRPTGGSPSASARRASPASRPSATRGPATRTSTTGSTSRHRSGRRCSRWPRGG